MPRNYNEVSAVDGEFKHLTNTSKNNQTYRALVYAEHTDVSRNAKLNLPAGIRLIKVVEHDQLFYIAMVSDAAEAVIYYIKCQTVSDVCLTSDPVTQVLLWRTQNIDYQQVTSGLADKVFLNILLKEFNIAASDANQTTQGRDFWVRMLGTVMREGYSVYRYDSWASECTYVQLKDHADIRDNSVDLWGDGEEYEHILALITKDPI